MAGHPVIKLAVLRHISLPHTLALICQCRDVPTVVTWAIFCAIIAMALPECVLDAVNPLLGTRIAPSPPIHAVYVFIFFRVAYNFGLGLLLRRQSRTQFLTRFVESLKRRGESSWQYRLVRKSLRGTLRVDAINTLPPPFCAWILARYIINIILPSDVLAFSLVVVKYAAPFDAFSTPFDAFSAVTGLILILASINAKVSAHKTLGQFAWFYGDFFYLLDTKADAELAFDGVFQLFPHPMYTVGYFWCYGAALLSRSYVVFVLALLAHFSQMAFLVFVESPHIEKLYGSENVQSAGDEDTAAATSATIAARETKHANIFVVKNFDKFRATDWSLVLLVVVYALMLVVGTGAIGVDGPIFGTPNGVFGTYTGTIFVANALLWKLVSALAIGLVLVNQDRSEFWTHHFEERECRVPAEARPRRTGENVADDGTSGALQRSGRYRDAHAHAMTRARYEAFEQFKRFANLTRSMEMVSLILCGWWFFHVPDYIVHTEGGRGASLAIAEAAKLLWGSWRYQAEMLSGAALVGVSWWSFHQCYLALGDYGWFYGDFFIPDDAPVMSYTGIYRYLNNPDAVLGQLWIYGLALICHSTTIALLAVVSQTVNLIFAHYIEEPHLRMLYKSQVRKDSSAVSRALKNSIHALLAGNWRLEDDIIGE